MKVADWEIISHPTMYEVFELLIMMLKKRLHERISSLEVQQFFEECHTLGLNLIRAYLCSFSSLKKKSTDIAPAAL